LFLALLLLVVAALPARGIGVFGPPVTVYEPPCQFEAFNADTAQDSTLEDPFGYRWSAATHIEDVPSEPMAARLPT
jgi:hypothetical protein